MVVRAAPPRADTCQAVQSGASLEGRYQTREMVPKQRELAAAAHQWRRDRSLGRAAGQFGTTVLSRLGVCRLPFSRALSLATLNPARSANCS
jgi:hypothetical protein